MSAQGEDRSDFQAVTPWTGLDFGFAKATEGLGWAGKTFKANWANLHGKPRGAYHFLHPDLGGAEQARVFYAFVKVNGGWRDGDMAVVDSELMSGVAAAGAGAPVDPVAVVKRSSLAIKAADVSATTSQVDTCTKAFLDEVMALAQADGVKIIPVTYTMHVVGQHLTRTAAAYPDTLWFAYPSHSAPEPWLYAPWKAWRFWQWHGGSPVDKDAYNGDTAALKTWIAGQVTPPKVTVVVTTDGKTSVAAYAARHGNDPWKVVQRTLLHGLHPRLLAYSIAHRKLQAPAPKGIRLLMRETKR